MVNLRKSRNSPSPSTADLRVKFSRIAFRHQQMKIAFHDLKSQIQIGLLEVENVFASLAIPLMRLVGLKTDEMAEEGRISTIIVNTDLFSQPGWQRRGNGSEWQSKSSYSTEGGDDEDSYTAKATMAGKELVQKQRLQLMQLVNILKQLETQVNSSRIDILQILTDHRASIHKFFQKAMTYVATIHQAGQNHGIFFITLQLLRATFERVDVALGSIEGEVEDLMHELAEQMCPPMVEYVKGLKVEMTMGTCLRLLAIVEEMGGALRDGKIELEQARRKVRVAEERSIEALKRLKQSEERIKRTEEYFVPNQILGGEQEQAKDERLLWELLRKKRKYQRPESPLGPQDLLCNGPNNNHLNSNIGETTNQWQAHYKELLEKANSTDPMFGFLLALGLITLSGNATGFVKQTHHS